MQNVPAEVMLWTNHRVMEWLRTIDLSEYAPNLRGSGVHGALMVRNSCPSMDVNICTHLSVQSSYTNHASTLSINLCIRDHIRNSGTHNKILRCLV